MKDALEIIAGTHYESAQYARSVAKMAIRGSEQDESRYARMGRESAHIDHARGCGKSAPWGNTEYDAAYDAEWARILEGSL